MILLAVLLVALVLALAYRAAWERAGAPEDRGLSRQDVSELWQRREEQRRRRRAQARARRLPPLPPEDAPPAGLAPLVPSPRTVRVEAVRGIRELESWLADQACA